MDVNEVVKAGMPKQCPYRREHEYDRGLCRHCYAPEQVTVAAKPRLDETVIELPSGWSTTQSMPTINYDTIAAGANAVLNFNQPPVEVVSPQEWQRRMAQSNGIAARGHAQRAALNQYAQLSNAQAMQAIAEVTGQTAQAAAQKARVARLESLLEPFSKTGEERQAREAAEANRLANEMRAKREACEHFDITELASSVLECNSCDGVWLAEELAELKHERLVKAEAIARLASLQRTFRG